MILMHLGIHFSDISVHTARSNYSRQDGFATSSLPYLLSPRYPLFLFFPGFIIFGRFTLGRLSKHVAKAMSKSVAYPNTEHNLHVIASSLPYLTLVQIFPAYQRKKKDKDIYPHLPAKAQKIPAHHTYNEYHTG